MTNTLTPAPAHSRVSGRKSGASKAWRYVGAVLAIGAIGWAVFTFVGLVAYDHVAYHHVYTQPISSVDISASSGSVTILADGGDHVNVDAIGTRGLNKPSDNESVVNGTLTVHSACHAFGNWCGLHYTVHVPIHTSVKVHVGDGNSTVDGVTGLVTMQNSNGTTHIRNISGTVNAQSSNGSITASNIIGNVTLNSSNDDVTGINLQSDQVNLHSSNGNVSAQLINAPSLLTAKSSNGNVTVQVPQNPNGYSVDSQTSNGQVKNTITTNNASAQKIKAHSSNGDVTLRYNP